SVLILTVIVVVLAGALIATLLLLARQPAPQRGLQPLVEIAPYEPDSAKWGLNFPNQYATFLLTGQNAISTTYGGSLPISKLEQDPRLVTLFAGMAFSKDYKEDRGHRWSLEDVQTTGRVNEKSPATCYSCKSANPPSLWAEMGMREFGKQKFYDMGARVTQPIGCANCHEANTMRLIVTNPALEEALTALGKDWSTFTRQEMRTVVCANCHVEYYFQGDDKYLVFPWRNGTRIEEIAQYYAETGFVDWQYPDAGTPMVKIQHPEYELYTADSTHYRAGVSCADCHMPYTRDGAAKFSSHNIKSPFLMAEAACGACHTDVTYVVERAKRIQDQVHETLSRTEDALIAAIDALKAAASDASADQAKLAEARALHREAQLRWDFILSENSMGFHNSEEALRILATAIDLARQAQLKAIAASQEALLARALQ
ncbi:MAG: ammonia-forming cytochrome c nitrite reductase subunit c552, partial [Anaerolineae bacterium]|nr:ammonia-forming cytochrome c nitrite reductase subunit c552 [Anaerolineae bacterium]